MARVSIGVFQVLRLGVSSRLRAEPTIVSDLNSQSFCEITWRIFCTAKYPRWWLERLRGRFENRKIGISAALGVLLGFGCA